MDWLGLALLLLAGLVVGLVILAAHTARLLTRPPRRAYAYALAAGLPADPRELTFADPAGATRAGATFEQWTFRARGVDLPVWDIAGCRPDGPTVILTHGWGDSRVVSLVRVPTLLRHARRVILWDLPAHADAPGTFTLGVREGDDLVALVEALAGPVVLHGHSLGAGVSIVAARRLGPERVAGVIAESAYRFPITPARNVMRMAGVPYRVSLPLALSCVGVLLRQGPGWWRARDGSPFDRAAHAKGLRTPLLVLHGDADAVCPLAEAREIAAAAAARLVVIPGAGHLDLFADPRFLVPTEAAIADFLATLRVAAPVA